MKKKIILQFTSYNTKSENNRIFRGQLHPSKVIMDSKQKLRCNEKEIPYIFAKFQNFLNFRVRDLPLLETVYTSRVSSTLVAVAVATEIYFDARNLLVFVPRGICHSLYARRAF